MAETLIKIDRSKSAYENEQIHNRWHPDIPMAATVKPGTISFWNATTGPVGKSKRRLR